ncbi:ABC transporter ATP-binding protein [Candidatus Spongiisocius sp.]|uniref:ABC transporter ATP-binding protein n=1 Tax=Candidatus Spongiisocius sp. TaxID=3101273 RepID=UPI003B5BC1D6
MIIGGERRAAPDAGGVEALDTIKRGMSLSPEIRRGMLVTIALAVVATAGRVIIPVAIQQVLDGGLTEASIDMGFVARMVVVSLGAVAITAIATGLMHLRLAVVSEVALSNLRVRAFRHIHDLSMLHQASEQRGVLVARVTSDIDQISRFLQWAGLMILINGGQAILSMAVMAAYSWQMFLAVLALLPLILYSMRWFQKRLVIAHLVVREKVGRMLGALAEAVAGAPVIRAYGIEDRVRTDLDRVIEEHRAAGVRAGGMASGFSGVSELLTSAVTAGVLVVGAVLVSGGDTSVGTVVAFMFLVQLMILPLNLLGEAINEAQGATAGWKRVLDVLDIPPDVADPGDDGMDLPPGSLGIRFEGVTFRYPRPGEIAREATGTTALEGVSVELAPRSHVAVVGETGSGKTTFAKLATRLMDASEGEVLLGGVDVTRIRFSSLRHRVVMVPQDGMLFRGTILENVQMGKPGVARADVERAFVSLGLTGWLSELGQGLDTPVGERGGSLSVGERQLVTLVRAAIADPYLLVLDEATSAVDPATEVRISRALGSLTEGRTVITIAHRLSTAEAADRVLVFDLGRIAQDGPHRQLVGEPGPYRHLHEAWERGTVSHPTH